MMRSGEEKRQRKGSGLRQRGGMEVGNDGAYFLTLLLLNSNLLI